MRVRAADGLVGVDVKVKRKRGGQRKPRAQRKNSSLTIRMLDELRRKLAAAAHNSGRSVSEEVAWRLTLSFLFNTEIQEIAKTQDEIRHKK